jgi:hypothetical protein
MRTVGYLSAAVVVVIAAISGSASAQIVPPAGRMYIYHSPPTYPCPGLDWLLVAGENGSITGMVAWDGMRSMAKAEGTIKDGQVNLTAAETGGQGRTATMTGTVDAKGWLVLNITTPNVKCEGVNVPFYAPS